MKKNEDLKIDVQNAKDRKELLNAGRSATPAHAGSHLRKLFYVVGLVGAGLFLNGCMSGYVESEPAYVQYNRPPQPSNVHLWIDGDWYWNNQQRTYVQHNGYWETPRQGRTYVSGSWQTNSRGTYWKKGQWVRHDDRRNAYYR